MTTLPPRRTPYFVAGGTLGPRVPSYVTRPTDDELFERVLAGELCYVLTPRQMGKSSLVARTIVRLRKEQIGAVAVDLQDSGGLDEETFYLNILDELRRAFRLDLAVEEWWDANGRLGASLRFRRFFTDHLLPQINGRVVIFIDEIDTMLTMPFRDNFFAAIRALFNGRSGDPELERLTFVLLGVASPSELIKDPDRTPFNIGSKINLREFEPADAEPLLKGLQKAHPTQAKAILERIFYWTSGHPYLTQQLCLLINQTPDQDWHDAQIDELVRQTFLSDEARNEDNIKLIQSRISASPNKRRLLKLYQRVYRGETVKENKASVAQNQLLLSGLVSLADGRLQVRNQIYRNVFDRDWIRRETEINWGVVIGAIGGIIALLAILALYYDSVTLPNRRDDLDQSFRQSTSSFDRANALGDLASIQTLPFIGDNTPYEQIVRELFFDIPSWEAQKAIYNPDHFRDSPDRLVELIKVISTSMVDTDESGQTTQMLAHMADSLGTLEFEEAIRLQQEIDQWVQARTFTENGELENALEAYNNAITINPNNQATLFERARVFTELGNTSTDQIVSADNYRLALEDLDRVVSFILLQPEPEEGEVLPTSTATLTPTATNTAVPTNTATQTAVSSPTSPLLATPTLELTVASTSSVTAMPTNTTQPIATIAPTQPPPTPTPTPTPRPLPPQFNTRSQWLNLIRDFLQNEPDLASVLVGSENPENIYPNLLDSSLIETTATFYEDSNSNLPAPTPITLPLEVTSEPLTPTPPLAFPPENANETLIIIAEFSRSEGVLDNEIQQEIRRAIANSMIDVGIENVRVEVLPSDILINDRGEAEVLGEQTNATIIIWGQDTGSRVTVNFLNLKSPDFDAAFVTINETERTQFAQPDAYSQFIVVELPNQLTSLSLFAIGQSFQSQADFETAILLYDKALELVPFDFENDLLPLVHDNRGNAYFVLGQISEAIADYDQAIALNPEFTSAYLNSGIAYAGVGDYESAIAYYDQAIALNPEYALAYYNRGIARSDQGDLEGAIADYDQAIVLNPEYANAYLNRGIAHGEMANKEAALADFRRYLELRPNAANRSAVENVIAKIEAELGDN